MSPILQAKEPNTRSCNRSIFLADGVDSEQKDYYELITLPGSLIHHYSHYGRYMRLKNIKGAS